MEKKNKKVFRLQLYTRDYDKTYDFYKNKLGMPVLIERVNLPDDRVAVFGVGSGEIEVIFAPNGMEFPQSNGWTVQIQVDDAAVSCERFRKAGCTISREPQNQFWGHKNFKLIDPSGLELTFYSEIDKRFSPGILKKYMDDNNGDLIIHGIFVDTPTIDSFRFHDSCYLVCQNEKVVGFFDEIPLIYKSFPVFDFHDKLIIPGMSDLHMHVPQYAFRGLGQNMDEHEWSSWFEKYAFPEESSYENLEYAELAYEKFVHDLLHTTTTRICAFATIHREPTEILMNILDRVGFAGFVGKVNMDRNSASGLLETTRQSVNETEIWLLNTSSAYKHIHPIVTPRYIPSCSDELMEELGKLCTKYNVPIQSHLLESPDEIKWVKSLKPQISCYSEAYDMFGLFGETVPAVMAHCVYPEKQDFEIMKKRKPFVAHCPGGNMHSSGGLAPILDYLDFGIPVGLGSDTAGGNTINLFKVMLEAIMVSKVKWAKDIREKKPDAPKRYLTLANVFYLATKGGGSFFGKVGSFETGYSFDAVVLDDERIRDYKPRSNYERLERIINLSDDRDILAKFICGKKVL